MEATDLAERFRSKANRATEEAEVRGEREKTEERQRRERGEKQGETRRNKEKQESRRERRRLEAPEPVVWRVRNQHSWSSTNLCTSLSSPSLLHAPPPPCLSLFSPCSLLGREACPTRTAGGGGARARPGRGSCPGE